MAENMGNMEENEKRGAELTPPRSDLESTQGQTSVPPVKKSFWKTIKKILIWTLVVFVLVIGLMVWAGNNIDTLEKKFYGWQADRYEKALKKLNDEAIAKYTDDLDGGKTPEETIDLFISALKEGDIERASKYYVLEKQEEELLFLKDIFQKNGNLQQSVDFYLDLKKNGIKKCNTEMRGCTIEYYYTSMDNRTLSVKGRSEKILIPAGERSLRSESFTLNRYTNVWKIGQ